MRILCFEHHPQSPAGLVAERLLARGGTLHVLSADRGTAIPADALDHDGLLILGGAMNAYADEVCPHFPALLALAREFAVAAKPVLGICLGAQLLARAFGAAVHLGAAREFGLVDLMPMPGAAGDPLLAGMPAPVPAMQWHDDTFDLPPDAVALLSGRVCRNQAFRVAGTVYGFQCHLETDRGAMLRWAEMRRALGTVPGVPDGFAEQVAASGPLAERFGRHVADRWLDLVEARRRDEAR